MSALKDQHLKNQHLKEQPKEKPLNESYQQQVLFAQSDDLGNGQQSLDDILPTKQQVIIEHDDWQQDEETEQQNLVEQAIFENIDDDNLSTKPRWLWRSVFALFMVLIGVEAFDYFTSGFIDSPITTSIVALITLCLTVLCGTALLRELLGLRQFKQQQKIKTQAFELLNSSSSSSRSSIENNKKAVATHQTSIALCETINANLPCDLQFEGAKNWQHSIQVEHNSEEVLQLYSRTVLSKVDERAINEIAKFSTESVVLVALSPVALIDMLIMLWRNLRMIDKIAGLYGLKLGYWSRIKLIKQVFVNMAYAGASEMLTDVGADMLGADILGKISGRLAQGLGAGMLTARLGLRVLKLARPISFNCPQLIDDQPKLGLIRKAVISQVSTLIKNKS
ncbi:MAG: TIGR01620 family protein [Alteromonadaceae bacterium]|nr:TIGR01620 family protein [Alteromonadaceae bacterium]